MESCRLFVWFLSCDIMSVRFTHVLIFFHRCTHIFLFTKKKIPFHIYIVIKFPSKDKRFTLNQPPSSVAPDDERLWNTYHGPVKQISTVKSQESRHCSWRELGTVTGSKEAEASGSWYILVLDLGVFNLWKFFNLYTLTCVLFKMYVVFQLKVLKNHALGKTKS